MLPEEALIKAAASLLSGTIGVFVLIGSRRRAANIFLAAFMFLLAGNQFAETMRALAVTSADTLFWFRIASIFAFLDPLALYYFGSVFPDRNRLNSRLRVGAVFVFCASLALSVGVLEAVWTADRASIILLSGWALGTVVIYGAVLREALRQIGEAPSDSAYAELVPALCVITVPAVLRAVWSLSKLGSEALLSSVPGGLHRVVGLVSVLAVTFVLLGHARSYPEKAAGSRRLVAAGAWAGLAFAAVSKPGMVTQLLPIFGISVEFGSRFGPIISGAGDAVKLLTFGVLASAAVLRNRILDLSLEARRWAARILAGFIVVVGLGGTAILFSVAMGAEPVFAQPGLLALMLVVLVSTQGFRRLVDIVAEKAYGVPRGSHRQDRIDAYRAAVEQAIEEDRILGSDPQLRRLRNELEIEDSTAHVLERMVSSSSGGPLRPDETIDGRYRIKTFVGRGSSGRIFRAHDELLGRDVAIKELLHGGPHESARALEEARVAGRLDHPNIATIHDVITRPGASLLVTEFIDGPNLAEVVASEGPFPLDDVLDVLDGILSGLEAVHAQDIVHGDLKPANILLGGGSTPKIADFGTSRVADGGTLHATGDSRPVEGTPAYMAPEQKEGEPASRASDLYAVAILADEIAQQPLPDPVERVVQRGRAEDPAERFASATEMRDALREAFRASVTSGR